LHREYHQHRILKDTTYNPFYSFGFLCSVTSLSLLFNEHPPRDNSSVTDRFKTGQ
jgi:hypothetical protein